MSDVVDRFYYDFQSGIVRFPGVGVGGRTVSIPAALLNQADGYPCGEYALAPRVLVVAILRCEGWVAFCGVISPGDKDAWRGVARHGARFPEEAARALFPKFDRVPYAP